MIETGHGKNVGDASERVFDVVFDEKGPLRFCGGEVVLEGLEVEESRARVVEAAGAGELVLMDGHLRRILKIRARVEQRQAVLRQSHEKGGRFILLSSWFLFDQHSVVDREGDFSQLLPIGIDNVQGQMHALVAAGKGGTTWSIRVVGSRPSCRWSFFVVVVGRRLSTPLTAAIDNASCDSAGVGGIAAHEFDEPLSHGRADSVGHVLALGLVTLPITDLALLGAVRDELATRALAKPDTRFLVARAAIHVVPTTEHVFVNVRHPGITQWKDGATTAAAFVVGIGHVCTVCRYFLVCFPFLYC